MIRTMKPALAVAACAWLAGCGTALRGTTEEVEIKSFPADAKISTSNGFSCPESPCKVKVGRKDEFTAYADKDGYKRASVDIKTKVGGEGVGVTLVGNAFIGGLIGAGVDVATGATLDHTPNPAVLVLEPENPKDPKTPVVTAPPEAYKKPHRKPDMPTS